MEKKKRKIWWYGVGLGAMATVGLYHKGEELLRSSLLHLSSASWARNQVTHLPVAQQVADRFVAGETISEAISVAKELNEQGFLVTVDYLGESVTNEQEADEARNEIIQLFDQIEAHQIKGNVSLKLTQLGLRLREDLAVANLRLILEHAAKYNNRVRIDMEESGTVDVTLRIYRYLRDELELKNVGVVMQAYLYRTEDDIAQLAAEGSWIRLCKGAYAEPEEAAFPIKADTDQNYIKLMQKLLSDEARENGVYVGIATHDEQMIEATKQYVAAEGIAKDAFEFQMLYGIRRELQAALIAEGYQLRVYIPYGTAWYPYFMRRLAERPANLWFFASNFFKK